MVDLAQIQTILWLVRLILIMVGDCSTATLLDCNIDMYAAMHLSNCCCMDKVINYNYRLSVCRSFV